MATSECPIIYYGCRITNHSKNCYRFLFTSSCLCCIIITLPCFIYHHLETKTKRASVPAIPQETPDVHSKHTQRDPQCSFQPDTKRPLVFFVILHPWPVFLSSLLLDVYLALVSPGAVTAWWGEIGILSITASHKQQHQQRPDSGANWSCWMTDGHEDKEQQDDHHDHDVVNGQLQHSKTGESISTSSTSCCTRPVTGHWEWMEVVVSRHCHWEWGLRSGTHCCLWLDLVFQQPLCSRSHTQSQCFPAINQPVTPCSSHALWRVLVPGVVPAMYLLLLVLLQCETFLCSSSSQHCACALGPVFQPYIPYQSCGSNDGLGYCIKILGGATVGCCAGLLWQQQEEWCY